MANDLTANPIRIDTAQATGSQVRLASQMYIKSIRWASATTAGHALQVYGYDNKELWTSVATGANYTEESLIEKWWPYFRVQLIQSGIAYITYG